MVMYPSITDFSHELLCQILKYLPLREILSVAMLCRKMSSAVDMHLRLCKSIDFCQDAICGYMSSTITDDHLLILLKKCPHLETVYGLHPVKIERRRLRKRSALTIPGIIEALSLCFRLKAIETSDLRLFEAIMQHLPHIEIIGHFQNRDGLFPPQASQRLKLQPYPRISSLHLIGVEVPELTAMPHLQHLHLQCVRFTKLQPFRAFLAQNLKSFVMKHCIGPSMPQRYLSLIIALSSAPNLNHLELVRLPLLNGLFQRAVEDSYRHNGFVNLRTLVISGCKGALEADLGHLMIVSSKNLETLYIQPSLTKDSLFVSLSYAQCSFPRLQNIHLGYIDTLNSSDEWSNDALLSFGLAEVPDTPSSITDSGMKVISELFPHIKTMCVSNCPHLMVMYHWMSSEANEAWSRLTDLTLQKCHCLQLSSFAVFISSLPSIEVVVLNDMFREPPKGCSHVGLSAGTGLGMSSAVVSNQDEHIAVQGHHQDFEHPGDEENEENGREFIENEDNQEPHFMVLQRDFFDGEEGGNGGDASVEDQNPDSLEQEHSEEHNSIENGQEHNSTENGQEHNSTENGQFNNSQSVNEDAMVKVNSTCNDNSLKTSSVNDKPSILPSSSLTSNVQNANKSESKYYLRKTSMKSIPSTKSAHVQCNTLPLDCYQSSNSDLKNIEGNSFDSGEISDNSYSSDKDIKSSPKDLDLEYIDYDPYKPSTSKAGRHLDYSATSNTNSCNISDSDIHNDCDRNTKEFKQSLSKNKFSQIVGTSKIKKIAENKLSGTNCSLKSGIDDCPPEAEHDENNKIPDNPTLSTQNVLNDCDSSLSEMCKLVRPCKVLVTKLEKGILSDKTSNSNAQNSNVLSEHEGHSLTQSEVSLLASCSSPKEESDVFTDSHVAKSRSYKSNKLSPDVRDSVEKLPEIVRCSNSFEHKNEISVHDSENSLRKTNSSVNENVSENMSCYVLVEKLDKLYCEELLRKCDEGKELPKAGSNSSQEKSPKNKLSDNHSFVVKLENSIDNIPEHSCQIEMSCEHIWQEGTSKDNYKCMKTDNHCDSMIKTEDESSHIYVNESHIADEVVITVSCSEMCQQCLPLYERQHETENVCSSSDNKYSLNNSFCGDSHKVLSTNNYNSGKKLDNEVIINKNGSSEFHPVDDGSKKTEEKLQENEVHIIDINCDILSVNIGAEQEALDQITANENKGTSKINVPGEISKMQKDELSKSTEKENALSSSKNHPLNISKYENSVIEKQNSKYQKKLSEGSAGINLINDNMGNLDCSNDEHSTFSQNESREMDSKNLRIKNFDDPCQPSTSKAGNNYHECSRKQSKPVGSTKPQQHLKNGTSTPHAEMHANSSYLNTVSEDKVRSCSSSEMQNIEVTVKDKNNGICEPDLELPQIQRLTKSDNCRQYNTDSKYFVSVSDDDRKSFEIINSSTGASYTPPVCSILLIPIDNKDFKPHLCSKVKNKHKKCNSSKKLDDKQSKTCVECNPYLPSTSKQENHHDCAMETCKLHNAANINNSHKCVSCERRAEKMYSARSEKQHTNSSKTSDMALKVDNMEDFRSQYIVSSKKCVCKCYRKTCDPPSDISMSSKFRAKKLKISNSDAFVFTKNPCCVEENCKLSLHIDTKYCAENIDANNLESKSYSNQEVKLESDTGKNNFSKYSSEVYQNDNTDSKNDIVSDSTEKDINSFSHNSSRTKKRRISPSPKREMKLEKTPSIKSNHSSRLARNCSKKVSHIPTISVISQGTQATSADIRRSVRRVKRTRSRRTLSSHVSRNSTHSNRISSKTLNKRPLNMNPRAESYDKATSTSDPLLEDDAVQSLLLTSKTLLSFTVVACGISDIIIDYCPKLFHFEVQACRILKKFRMNYCPAMKRLNISQCPKLSIYSLVPPVMSVEPDPYFLVSYEPCMQDYYHGEGEKVILSKVAVDQNVLICHDFNDISHEGIQAMFKEKLIEWCSYLTKMHAVHSALSKSKTMPKKNEILESTQYPWSHNLRRIIGKYRDSSSTNFCHSEGRYQLVTNNTIFGDIFETHHLDTGFPSVSDCEALKDASLISHEAKEKSLWMKNKFIGFYIPITENN